MSLIETGIFVKELGLAIITWGGIYATIYGVSSWKKHLVEKDQYELAKRLLLCTYKYKEQMASLRNPMVSVSEYSERKFENENITTSTDEHKKYENLIDVYRHRREKLLDIKHNILDAVYESQMLLNHDIKDIYDDIFKLEFEIKMEINKYLLSMEPNNVAKESYDSKIIFDSLDENTDYFRSRFNPLLKKVEDHLLPKIQLFHEHRGFNFLPKFKTSRKSHEKSSS